MPPWGAKGVLQDVKPRCDGYFHRGTLCAAFRAKD